MCKRIVSIGFLSLVLYSSRAQTSKGISMDDYEKAKTFLIKDLDNDTYVKFGNNSYVLDRYEAKKPYFITGDDGLKKRMDLYTLSSKADGRMLGTIIYYTNEKGKLFTACLPNTFADGKVWERYFEDIHAIDKVEKNFVLKLSYVLSKEYSYQAYKSTLKGKEVDRSEAGTYGNDICFPGDEQILLANGDTKLLSEVKAGDQLVSVDPFTRQSAIVTVNKLVSHDAKNYAITQLTLLTARQEDRSNFISVQLLTQQLEATPNHPMMTKTGIRNIGSLKEGEEVLGLNTSTGKYEPYIVWNKTEKANGVQKVYTIDASGGTTFVMNGIVVMQK